MKMFRKQSDKNEDGAVELYCDKRMILNKLIHVLQQDSTTKRSDYYSN